MWGQYTYTYLPILRPSSGMSTREHIKDCVFLHIFLSWHARRWPKSRPKHVMFMWGQFDWLDLYYVLPYQILPGSPNSIDFWELWSSVVLYTRNKQMEYRALVKWYWQGNIEVLGENLQISHTLTRDRTRSSAVRSQLITAWATVRQMFFCVIESKLHWKIQFVPHSKHTPSRL